MSRFDPNKYEAYEKYADYEQDVRHSLRTRQERRKRKPRVDPNQHKRSRVEEAATLADLTAYEKAQLTGEQEDGFQMSYNPGQYEAAWLLDSLRMFYHQQIVVDVLAQVKGGKEASVYRCAAHPTVDAPYVAAKVYRPRMFRELSNDKVYREGRGVLSADGHDVDGTDRRMDKAIASNSAFGQQVKHTSWLMHEFKALQRLHEAGAAVPKPYAAGENAIVMAYLGDGAQPAPTLNQVRLPEEEAQPLFDRIMHSIRLMLDHGWVHGDLSAYNILYWQGEVTLIDFPQIVAYENNPQAYNIFARDITRVCDYFNGCGLSVDAEHITADLWEQYAGHLAKGRLADFSRHVDQL